MTKTLDYWDQKGDKIPLTLVEDPANPGQFLHKAGGGTAAVPSSDVQTVQYPTSYVGKATLALLNAAYTVDTLGASQIQFHIATMGSASVIIEGTNSNATSPAWTSLRSLYAGSFGPVYPSPGAQFVNAGNTLLVDCAGQTQIRFRLATYTSGSIEVLAHRSYCPALRAVASEPSNTSSNPIYTIASQQSVFYADTATPLGTSASFTGSTRTMLAGLNAFNALYIADQPSIGSAATIQGSSDSGVTWRAHAVGTQTAGTPVPLRAPRTVTTYRLAFSNGPTGQGYFSATSSQTPN